MFRLYIAASLVFSVILVEGGIFDVDSALLENDPVCREFNETLSKYVRNILDRMKGSST